ncbi:hypothetical protein Nepgr_017162 [Nepenthes gracilis]|uniref:Uncharacterized protein n=1 Tax=Nepenthes gracilis TaxID=150966 RepID=A0AAD3SS17_NEPGR|nr:hypothetical protein Nepgr_017162 [Nepenthes gracilis]
METAMSKSALLVVFLGIAFGGSLSVAGTGDQMVPSEPHINAGGGGRSDCTRASGGSGSCYSASAQAKVQPRRSSLYEMVPSEGHTDAAGGGRSDGTKAASDSGACYSDPAQTKVPPRCSSPYEVVPSEGHINAAVVGRWSDGSKAAGESAASYRAPSLAMVPEKRSSPYDCRTHCAAPQSVHGKCKCPPAVGN